MDINFSISPVPGIATNYLVAAVYDPSAPNTVVASQSFAAPHSAPIDVAFTGLNGSVYRVDIYESATTAPAGTLRHTFLYDPTFQGAQTRDDLFLIGGETAGFAVGATGYSDASLSGWVYSVERRGVGTLRPGIDINVDTSQNWNFINSGDKAGVGDIFVLHFLPQISISQPLTNQQAGVVFSSTIVLIADTTLDTSHIGKRIILAGAGSTLNITLPPIASIPDNKLTEFISEGGIHINAAIIVSDAQIKFLGLNKSAIYLGKSESIWIFCCDGSWYATNAIGNFKTVGQRIASYSKTMLNTLLCDGSIKSRANYPRLWEWINTQIEASLLIDDSVWNFQNTTSLLYENMGKFSKGDGSTTFRLPIWFDVRDTSGLPTASTGFFRGVDGTVRAPGTYEQDGVGNFFADITGKIVAKSGSDNRIIALGNISDANLGQQAVTAIPISGKDRLGNAFGETRPASIGEYQCILI